MSSLTEMKPLELVARILELMDRDADHFTLLGVGHSADSAEIKQTFVKLARGLHPDLPVFQSVEEKGRATRAFQAVTRAQMVLTDPARRTEYMHELGVAPSSGGAQEPNPDLARIHVHRARQLLSRRDWSSAEASLRVADTLYGEEEHSDCRVELGWAIFNNDAHSESDRASQSKEIWETVLGGKGDAASVAQAHYYMAIWCKLNGEVPRVKKHLDECLSINSRHVDAKRELRLFERRRSSTSSTRRATGASWRPTGSSRTSGERRPRATTGEHGDAAAPTTGRPEAKKVPLKRRVSLLERIFGKGEQR